MIKASQAERRRKKEETILKSAKDVFCRKGFIEVTMQDIIDECSISRGGIYLYFSSVDEIYMEVVKRRNHQNFEAVKKSIEQNRPFIELLDAFLASHKRRLLHMEESMLRSTYEFLFSHKDDQHREFQQSLLDHVKTTIMEILLLGVRQGVLVNDKIDVLAENFMFVIEGLSILSLVGGITEEHINKQFLMIKTMLPYG